MPTETTRELLAKLLKRREELRSEFEALQNLINQYQGALGASALESSDEPTLDLQVRLNSRRLRSANLGLLLAEARKIILGEGRPLKRSELVPRLEANGYPVVGTDKAKVLGTNLWRSGRFKHFEGEGYWPSDVPRPSGR